MQLLNDLIGRKVTVYSIQAGAERQDVGILEATDANWIRLKKSEAEVLYFCNYHVRMVKPFDAH